MSQDDISILYYMIAHFMVMHRTKRKLSVIITIFAITTMSSLLFIPFLQIQHIIQNRNNDGYVANYYYYHNAFAYHGEEISQTLNYAHFLPLTGNNQSHQVKVIVNYSVTEASIVNQNMNAIMHVYTPNGKLIRISSFPHGFIINSTSGQSQLATTITNTTVKNVKANVIFTDATKMENFSNPLSVNLILGQKIPP
jgi:hypothetical protein